MCNPSNRVVYVYANLLMIHVTPITRVTLKLQQPLEKALVLGEPSALIFIMFFLFCYLHPINLGLVSHFLIVTIFLMKIFIHKKKNQ